MVVHASQSSIAVIASWAYAYTRSVVCLSVCLWDTTVNPTKTAEPINVLFGWWTRVKPNKPHIRWGPWSPWGTDFIDHTCSLEGLNF